MKQTAFFNDDTLSKRAGLTFVSSLLQTTVSLINGFLITPILVKGMGAELYGAWMMLQQSIGYLGISDFRPMGTLKFLLATEQHLEDYDRKKRQVGASILLWLATIPWFSFVTIGLLILLPNIIRVSESNLEETKLALLLVCLGVALDGIFSLPSNILRGVNADYKAMGLNAGILLMTGCFSALAILFNYGIIGVAVANVIGVIVNGATRFLILRKNVSWFGVNFPSWKEFIFFFKTTADILLAALGFAIFFAFDVILIGYIAGPVSAAVYSATSAVLKFSIDPLLKLITSGGPGITGLCGKKEWKRVEAVRKEMHLVTIASMTALGSMIILFNKPFVSLWVGEEYFGGMVLNVLLVVSYLFTLLYRVDNVIVDGLLGFRRKGIVLGLLGITVVILSFILYQYLGITGVVLSFVIGKAFAFLYFYFFVSKNLRSSIVKGIVSLLRPLIFMTSLFILSYTINQKLTLYNWGTLVGYACVGGVLTSLYVWFFLFSNVQRRAFLMRFASLLSLKILKG